ncbi:hypothetical protein [Rhodococcoides fascians]|uniref:hypothetical protein n=1 Tax=Rhodococcoides fascians TaxID=1828 RepID=UPI0005609A99|nr:hypothetical protein [Rhodococcus fascians]
MVLKVHFPYWNLHGVTCMKLPWNWPRGLAVAADRLTAASRLALHDDCVEKTYLVSAEAVVADASETPLMIAPAVSTDATVRFKVPFFMNFPLRFGHPVGWP